MLRSLLTACLLATALPAAAQTPDGPRAPEGYRLDVRTPASMYAFTTGGVGFRPSSRSWTPHVDGRRVSESRFYEVMGETDWARAASRRQTQAAELSGLGVAASLVGLFFIARGTPTLRECRRTTGGTGPCDRFDAPRALGGAALVVGGAVSISMALPLSRRVVPAREAAAAARRFNDGL